MSAPRVAFVHDWLTGRRGGEKVLDALCELLPRADLFTLLHVPESAGGRIEARRITPSVVQRLPGARRFYRRYLPIFPFAIEQFDLDAYDLVISTSHCAAKSVVSTGRSRHLCYCHSPMRYAWDQFEAYFGAARLRSSAARCAARHTLAALARWDVATSGRPHRYIANSQYVAERIRRYYNRRSVVVHPPVDTAFFEPGGSAATSAYLVVSALVPYKRLEVAVEACRLAGRALRIVGGGPDRDRLARLAGPGVELLGTLPDADVREEYRRARALILPGEEDFGIVPVEAQACGRPVIALARGGALETVIDGRTGILVETADAAAFAAGIARCERLALDEHVIRQHALRFSRERFLVEMAAQIDDVMRAPEDHVRW
jgi:glycosyltransferase involved in cell wall biosynthesis